MSLCMMLLFRKVKAAWLLLQNNKRKLQYDKLDSDRNQTCPLDFIDFKYISTNQSGVAIHKKIVCLLVCDTTYLKRFMNVFCYLELKINHIICKKNFLEKRW